MFTACISMLTMCIYGLIILASISETQHPGLSYDVNTTLAHDFNPIVKSTYYDAFTRSGI